MICFLKTNPFIMSSLELPLNHLILSVAFYLGKKTHVMNIKKRYHLKVLADIT